METILNLGDIVYSKSGRDQGRYYVVVEVLAEGYVKIADGQIRKIGNPKKKKVKHLKGKGINLELLAEKFKEGKQVFDSELKSLLRTLNENA